MAKGNFRRDLQYGGVIYLVVVRRTTKTFAAAEVVTALEVRAEGVTLAVRVTGCTTAGFQLQVAVNDGEEPLVALFWHPAMTFPLAKNLTLPAASRVTVIVVTIPFETTADTDGAEIATGVAVI
jgi:hypothetical protein